MAGDVAGAEARRRKSLGLFPDGAAREKGCLMLCCNWSWAGWNGPGELPGAMGGEGGLDREAGPGFLGTKGDRLMGEISCESQVLHVAGGIWGKDFRTFGHWCSLWAVVA